MDLTYKAVAERYERVYGEPLVADWDWVEPLYLSVEAAVASDPGEESSFETQFAETITRTADVIATITHGANKRLEAALREVRDMAAHPGFASKSGELHDAIVEIHEVADKALRAHEEVRA